MSQYISPFGEALVRVPSGSKIAVFSWGRADVSRTVTPIANNYAEKTATIGQTIPGVQSVYGTFTGETVVLVEASGGLPVWVDVGTSPFVIEGRSNFQQQTTPGTLNATGTLTWDLFSAGIVTSTTAAAVTATLPTGAVLDAASNFRVDDSVDFVVINIGGTNAITVTAAASGHTVVGAGAVAANSSGRFRTRKTAAATFVTYRVA